MLYVVQIVAELGPSFLNACSVTLRNLRPAGNARPHNVPQEIMGYAFGILINKVRLLGTRPDNAHVAE